MDVMCGVGPNNLPIAISGGYLSWKILNVWIVDSWEENGRIIARIDARYYNTGEVLCLSKKLLT